MIEITPMGMAVATAGWFALGMFLLLYGDETEPDREYERDGQENFFWPHKRLGERGIVTVCRVIFIFALSPIVIVIFIGYGTARRTPTCIKHVSKWLVEKRE